MSAKGTSQKSDDLGVLELVISDQVAESPADVDTEKLLMELNQRGWYLVRENEIRRQPELTPEELDYLGSLVINNFFEQREEAKLRVSEGNWSELEGPAVRMRKASQVAEKLGWNLDN